MSILAGLVAVPLLAAEAVARPHCNSFNYGIGDCVNEGPFRSNTRLPQSDERDEWLMEQPRMQPQGSGYPRAYPSRWW